MQRAAIKASSTKKILFETNLNIENASVAPATLDQ